MAKLAKKITIMLLGCLMAICAFFGIGIIRNDTQKALAEKTGIPLGSIKNWECGNYLPSVQSWEKLQSFFTPIKNLKSYYHMSKLS